MDGTMHKGGKKNGTGTKQTMNFLWRQLVPTGVIRYLDVGVEEEEADDHSFELIPLGARFPLLLFHQIGPGPGWG